MNIASKKIFWSLINIFVLVAIFVGIAGASTLLHIGNATQPTRTITVQGTGEVDATPDIAEFSVSVLTQGTTEQEVENESAQKINAVSEAIKDLGVDEKDIQTTSSNIYPRYQYKPETLGGFTNQREIVGYEANQSISVTVRDIEEAGELKAVAVEAGANSVSGPYLQFDDIEVYREQAREQAFDDARAKAKKMAKQAGVDLSRVVTFYENGGYGYGGAMMNSRMAMDVAIEEAAVEQVEIQPGQEKVTATVSVTYEIK